MSSKLSLSICIPNYKRLNQLIELVHSINNASKLCNGNYEIIISDDFSPNQKVIKNTIDKLKSEIEIPIRIYLNSRNIGYDANLRSLINKSSKNYIALFGNDDLMPNDFFANFSYLMNKFNFPKAIIRSYATFNQHKENIISSFVYTPNDTLLSPSPDTLAYIFKRSVVISGLIFERKISKNLFNEKYDGLLLYQVYLISKISLLGNVCLTNKILAYYRLNGIPEFGTSENESYHTPGKRTVNSSISFIRGLLLIAKEVSPNKRTFKKILIDLSKYSYPIISIQNDLKFINRIKYCKSLSDLGLFCTPYFFFYVIVYIVNLTRPFEFFVEIIKKKLGYTPKL